MQVEVQPILVGMASPVLEILLLFVGLKNGQNLPMNHRLAIDQYSNVKFLFLLCIKELKGRTTWCAICIFILPVFDSLLRTKIGNIK